MTKLPTSMAKRQGLIGRLENVQRMLKAQVERGGTVRAARSLNLIDRYNDLRADMIGLGEWDAWCSRHAYDPHHNGYDYFA